jgi:hypothetical protein
MQVTENYRWEVPSLSDPANYAMQLQRVAEQIEQEFTDLESWADHMSGGNTEVGAPAILREKNVGQSIPGQVNQYILWNTNTYDNTGQNSVSGTELYLPDQDQRYWWWIGLNLLMAPIAVNLRYTMQLLVQDYDPASGEVLTFTRRHKQYMLPVSGTGNQFMMFDGLYRSGGGRVRATVSHSSPFATSVDVLATSNIWAIRVCPAR